ncbi:hypothetical protein LPB260_16500 [Pseudomonas sp. LPB0260]|uniref:hypothetical protein n=1 Tax=Pseudomonas sp. LPB0260 TaxID=2614442 RepID=UPI0015C1E70F|nr:hypothetical protein [Pseudomonas sp. LPB0260]QLC72377.1 hypothetical protein LPB260_01550 [Pseudomonas sp. LPB0260]QLC75153.1 hypothetical protein LPB260_16500 [Pseudomonas sp. LPB0260]
MVLTEIDYPDELGQLLKEHQKVNRHDVWLWLYLYYREQVNLDPTTCNGLTMREEIAHHLKTRTRTIERLALEKDRYLVSYRHISWIEKRSTRQYEWLLPRIEEITDLKPGRGLPRGLAHLTGQTHLIAMLDLWDLDSTDKANKIAQLHNDWLRHKEQDSAFDWFADKKEGTKRCVCAWEWLKKNKPILARVPLHFSDYEGLLIYFDRADFGPNEQKAIIQQIKKRWNRQQFDERALDKKQFNVMLSITAIDLLKNLADTHNLKRAQVLERLITMESESGIYLDDG